MRALKGLFVYIGLVLGMIVALGVLVFGAMFFFPEFRIAGVGVVHGNHTDSEIINLTEYAGVDINAVEISVNSKNIDLTVMTPEIKPKDTKFNNYRSEIRGELSVDAFGLAYDITEYSVVKKVEVVDKILKVNFNVTEPSGMISYTNAGMVVYLPDFNGVDLSLNTEKGNIIIGNTTSPCKFQIGKLNISTNSGDFKVLNCYTDNDEKSLKLKTLAVNTGSGDFDFSDTNKVTVDNVIKLSGSDGKFIFKNLQGSINIVGRGIELTANEIVTGVGGFEFFCDYGKFNITKLQTGKGAENSIVTANCNVKINEIIGDTGILTTYGNIDINTLNDITLIKSEHGNVHIKSAKNNLTINTEYGDITVDSYSANGVFSSKRGNIKVKSVSEYADKMYTKITNEDGEINIDNNINKLLVATTGKSKVTVVFRQIKGNLDVAKAFEHRITLSNYSSGVVYLPTINLTPFKFKAIGNISGEISGLIPEYEGNTVRASEDYQYFPKASESNKDACQKSCYFEFNGTIHFEGYQNV